MIDRAARDTLESQLRGTVLYPGSPGYNQARQVWNGMIDRRPALIVQCIVQEDVANAIRFAREHDLLVSVRGGGHQVAGHAVCEGGLMIDLSPMRNVFVDPRARTVRVEGGCRWAEVDRQTQIFGLAVPNGYVSTTGVAGLTLGGGYGNLRNRYGLTADNLLSAEVVTASGNCITASEEMHPDLFWALRGGGGNFGVVTAFVFRCHQIGTMAYLNAPFYPVDKAAEIIGTWRDFMETAPDPLSSTVLFWTIPDQPFFPEQARGKTVVGVQGFWCGSPAEGARVTAPLRNLGETTLDFSGVQPYLQIQTSWDAFFPHGTRQYYFKASYPDRLDEEEIRLIIDAAASRPSLHSVIPLWHFGGAIKRVAPTATAFWHRSASFMVSFDAVWSDEDQPEANISWARKHWTAMMNRSHAAGIYVNFPGLAEEGDHLTRAAYGDNYDRLVQTKQKYDPTNLFRMNLNIAPD